MAKTKIKLRPQGFEELRRSPQAVVLIERLVDGAMDACGGEGAGYRGFVNQAPGRGTLGRAIGTVTTYDFEAILDNHRHQTLLRAFDRLGDV